jgi:small subunit ribosomal protein S20
MANHKSTLKRIRSSETKRLRNKYIHKTTRNAIKELRAATDKKVAAELYPKVVALVDKLAKNNIIHKVPSKKQRLVRYTRTRLFYFAL